jgi:hypothetical protein
MIISEDLIKKIEQLSRELTPVTEISYLLDIDPSDLSAAIADRHSEISIAYFKGRALTAHKLRLQEIEMAEAGSPMAVTLANQYLRDMDNDIDS